MKFAFTTLGTPDWTLERVAEAAKEYGYDGVELRLIDGDVISPALLRANRGRIEALFGGGTPRLVALAASAHFSSGDPATQRENRDACIEMIDVARELGVLLVRVFGGKRPDGIDEAAGIANVAAGLNAVAGVAEAAGVTVMLETHDDFCASSVVAAIMERVPSRAIAVHWDVQNTYKMGDSVSQAWERLGPRVAHVHVKDAVRGTEPWRRVLLGEGDVPVREAIRLLESVGYTGYVSVEMEKKWYPDQPAPEVALPQYIAGLRAFLGQGT